MQATWVALAWFKGKDVHQDRAISWRVRHQTCDKKLQQEPACGGPQLLLSMLKDRVQIFRHSSIICCGVWAWVDLHYAENMHPAVSSLCFQSILELPVPTLDGMAEGKFVYTVWMAESFTYVRYITAYNSKSITSKKLWHHHMNWLTWTCNLRNL